MPKDASFEQFQSVVNTLDSGIKVFRMWLADVLNQAEARFGDEWVQLVARAVGNEWRTIENWRYTYRNVGAAARMPEVAHSKHVEVAVLKSPDLQHRILELARDNELPTEDVRKLVSVFKGEDTGMQAQYASATDATLLEYLEDDDDVPFSDWPDNPLYSNDDRMDRGVAPLSWHVALDEYFQAATVSDMEREAKYRILLSLLHGGE
jgi:hypothetical protein